MGLLGVGSTISIGVLTWWLKHSRGEIRKHQQAESELRAVAKEALDARQDAEENERGLRRDLSLLAEQLASSKAPLNLQLFHLQEENARLTGKLEILRSSSSGDGAHFWARSVDPAKRPTDYEKRLRNSIPIILFANQKGGVGKTTLSTNLAAYFAAQGEKTLVIDVDYQGSTTGLMLAQSGERPEEFPSMVDLLFADTLNDLWAGTAIQKVAGCPNLDYVSCWYSFEKLERHLEFLWAADEAGDDVRFRLARAVLSPYVQNNYKRVFIDAPPRMTTGFINAVCASTHLFIPTVVDRVSASAVGTFARQLKELSDSANTVIELAGIIGTMTASPKLPQAASEAVSRANRGAQEVFKTKKDYFMTDAPLVRTTRISWSTEQGIAYLKADANTREMFEVIGRAIAKRVPTRSN